MATDVRTSARRQSLWMSSHLLSNSQRHAHNCHCDARQLAFVVSRCLRAQRVNNILRMSSMPCSYPLCFTMFFYTNDRRVVHCTVSDRSPYLKRARVPLHGTRRKECRDPQSTVPSCDVLSASTTHLNNRVFARTDKYAARTKHPAQQPDDNGRLRIPHVCSTRQSRVFCRLLASRPRTSVVVDV